MNHRSPNHECIVGCSGFSLIELIGVLAVLAILASMTTESVLTKAAAARRQAEMVEMSRIGASVKESVRRDHKLPTTSDWSSMAAAGLACPPSLIRTNPQGVLRFWVPDPRWALAGRSPSMAYQQDAYGTPKPVKTRALLISAPNGAVVDPAGLEFEAWWEGLSGVTPSGGVRDEGFRDDDFVVERLGFEPLFHRVVLNNLSTDSPARWAVDRGEDQGSCAPGRRHEAYYIESSRLLLIDSRGVIQDVVLVEEPSSWVFAAGRWHRRMGLESGPTQTDLAQIPLDLALLPAFSGMAQLEVSDAMYDLMGAYLRWSADGFRSVGPPASPVLPARRRVLEAAERLVDVSGHFLKP
jgi:prepilin-type N-terminal cleavage/methylation domain-containing protein